MVIEKDEGRVKREKRGKEMRGKKHTEPPVSAS